MKEISHKLKMKDVKIFIHAGKTHKMRLSNKKCKKQNNWTEYKEIGTLAHCQEEYKTWQPVWNSYGISLKNSKSNSIQLSILLLKYKPKN